MSKIHTSSIATRSRQRSTPVTTPLPGQIENSTGGFVYKITPEDQFRRFLILGVEGGTYYATENDLTKRSFTCIKTCLDRNPVWAINEIVNVSTGGLALKNEPALFALATAAAHTDEETRQLALSRLSDVARTGTHLYHFVSYVTALRGLGRGLRRAISKWFTEKPADKLAYQVIKYQQRDGWSARDLLRIAHPTAPSKEHEAVFRWIVGGIKATGKRSVGLSLTDPKASQPARTAKHRGEAYKAADVREYPSVKRYVPELIEAFEEAKTASTKDLVKLVTEKGLPREAVPTEKLDSIEVWEALLQGMPLTAMIRNLGKMSAIGLLKPLSAGSRLVTQRLSDREYLRKSRIHPVQVLIAHRVYEQGHGVKGSLTWSVVPSITAALDAAFYKTFDNVDPCGKPLLFGLDVSGSMESSAAGATALCACEVTAAFALVHASIEPACHVFGFANTFRELGIHKGMSLSEARSRTVAANFGSTDVSLAVQYAINNKIEVGGFVVMTDNEVNSGRHLPQALKEYRQRFVRDARCVMVATTVTECSCVDPQDSLCLDIAGFDPSVPSVVSNFIRGSTPARAETED